MHFLDQVRLAYACPLAWEKLVGGDRERYCAQCDKHVTNLTAMTRNEAQRFLDEADVGVCIRVEVDPAGRAIHRPAIAAATALALAACGGTGDSDSTGGVVINSTRTVIAEASDGAYGTHASVEATGGGASLIPEATTTAPAPTLIPESVDQVPVRPLMGEPPPISIQGGVRPIQPPMGKPEALGRRAN